MAKTIEDYKKSREKRREIIRKFGFMPLSVIQSLGNTDIVVYNYQNEKDEGTNYRKGEKVSGREYNKSGAFGVSAQGSHGGDRYSIMPAQLVEFAIKYWGIGKKIYLDPFAGQGVQMQVAKALKIDYIGYDICHKFMEFNRAVKKKISDNESKIELYEKDSRLISEEANGWDFCFTSPPYWDTEEYDDNEAQLGINKTYKEFLAGMKAVYSVMNYHAADDAIIVINVNDFRKKGKLYLYHYDTITVMKEAGFKITDICILGDGVVSGISRAFAVKFNNKQMLPRVHEYLIIGRK